MFGSDANEEAVPIGQAWLRQALGLSVPPPAVESYVAPGTRRTEVLGRRTIEFYPRQYAIDGGAAPHIRFALRHEPTDLGILIAALKAVDPGEIEKWVRAEPTGAYSRRAWFFYETFTGRVLDLADVRTGNYVQALDPQRHIVGERRNSARHRVVDNLLGGPGLCPFVRRTNRLTAQMALRLDDEARTLVARHDPAILARAVSYLYTKETRSSFAIEGERPGSDRANRFIEALKAAPRFHADKAALVRLQGSIVDPRYAAEDWRDFQNFIGTTVGGYQEEVHFICPRPGDVPDLMAGWATMTERILQEDVDPVVAAAVIAFAFVFIHPFQDGNGRIHRFLIHHTLAKRGYGPEDIIFPVSAAILRGHRQYDEALESFSRPLFDFIQWHWTAEREIEVTNATIDLYRYFDATAFAEYLYDRVGDTVRRDLKEELDFVATFDRAVADVRNRIDMPDRRAALFVRLSMQNGGRLSAAKRAQFAELSDTEVTELDALVQRAMAAAEAL